ncbi:hypothetical protein [Bacteroides sp. 51]|uniref:hypothetical protein n=1 Tax=Bacteroides sp. 51 TaxID=2302938 RepID=UPI0013D54CD2|nr:hypothetical protein [Bacteroides sp. 51]NDV82265.1 hypothetical protein [Bacteroides sp. 51]
MSNRDFLLSEISPKVEDRDQLLFIGLNGSVSFVGGKIVENTEENQITLKPDEKISIGYSFDANIDNYTNKDWEEWYKRRKELKHEQSEVK